MGKKKLIIGGENMQVYLALYGVVGEDYKYLIAQKNEKAKFFGKKIFVKGKKINGPCSWVFPGGKARLGKKLLCEAYREFWEETGIKKNEIKDRKEIGIGNHQYKVFFVYCTNLQDIVTKINNNLGDSDFVTDDELNCALLATKQEALNYFYTTKEDSSWFIAAIIYFSNQYLDGSNTKALWKINDFPDNDDV